MLKEFRDFISRGNVVDLAVAVVLGIAFGAIINAIVEGLITPLLGMIVGKDFTDMTFTINDSVFRYGLVINATIQFLAIAAAVFFLVVRPLNALAALRRSGDEDGEEPTETELLTDIRDLLRSRGGVD